MTNHVARAALSVFVLLALGAIPVYPSTITQYTDQTSWLAASSGLTLIDFNNLSITNFQTSVTTQSTVFASLYNGSSTFGTAIKDYQPDWGTGNYLEGPSQDVGNHYTLVVTLPSPVTAFAANIMYSGSYATTVGVQLSTGDTLASPVPTTIGGFASPAFVGVTSTTPFNQLTFTPTYMSSQQNLVLDNVQFGAAGGGTDAQTPEAATLILCGTGMALLLFGRRRRQKKQRERTVRMLARLSPAEVQ